MANYNIDLLLTIKNSNKLKQLNKDFQKTNGEQKRVRQGLKEMDKGYKKFFPSLHCSTYGHVCRIELTCRFVLLCQISKSSIEAILLNQT